MGWGILEKIFVTGQLELIARLIENIDEVSPGRDLDLGSSQVGGQNLDVSRHSAESDVRLETGAGGLFLCVNAAAGTRNKITSSSVPCFYTSDRINVMLKLGRFAMF